MKMTPSGKPSTIKSEISYSSDYRFKIWLLSVEEMSQLDVGYRAFLSHVLQHLENFRAQDGQILSHKLEPLALSLLTADDLYGFLGKNGNPEGPKRKISNGKIAILDAYFKLKHPHEFKEAEKTYENLAKSLTTYFSNHQGELFNGGALSEKFEADGGIFFPEVPFGFQFFKTEEAGNRLGAVRLPVYGISSRRQYFKISRICFPLKPSYFTTANLSSEEASWQNSALERFNSEPISIHQGIGFEASAAIHFASKYELVCLLRERTQRSPFITSFSIPEKTFQVELEDGRQQTVWPMFQELLQGRLQYQYHYCPNRKYCAKLPILNNYSEDFLDDVFRLVQVVQAENE